MSESSPFGLIIAVIIGIIVIILLAFYMYPKVPAVARWGLDKAESATPDITLPDLTVEAVDIDCANSNVRVHNVGDTDAESFTVNVNGETRTISLPSGSSIVLSGFALSFPGNVITVQVDTPIITNGVIEEVYENNNVATENC